MEMLEFSLMFLVKRSPENLNVEGTPKAGSDPSSHEIPPEILYPDKEKKQDWFISQCQNPAIFESSFASGLILEADDRKRFIDKNVSYQQIFEVANERALQGVRVENRTGKGSVA